MSAGRSRSSAWPRGGPAREPHGLLPAWPAVLAVVAHPDDESFGLGAIIDRMTSAGAAVHVLCYTRGEASTLNQTGADLLRQRARELRQAGAALGVSTVALLNYPDGRLGAVPPGELAAHIAGLAARYHPGGLLVFDDTGITGHPDHQAATQAAVRAAGPLGLPVLAWALPAGIASRLQAETGQPFAGQPAGRLDFAIRVSRARQRQAALLHASQVSPGSAALAAAGAAGRYRAPALARAYCRGKATAGRPHARILVWCALPQAHLRAASVRPQPRRADDGQPCAGARTDQAADLTCTARADHAGRHLG
jgi:N-acetylglucosamine malate deacetylase 2